MKPELTEKEALKFARQIMLPNFDFEKQLMLRNSKALMIGAGGLGCSVAQYLMASGLGQLTVVDDDKIERHNLPRQILYTEQDIGQLKATMTAQYLANKHPEAQITSVSSRLSDEALAKQIGLHDIVLDCSDNLATREQLNRLCYKLQVALVSGAAIRMEGQLFCIQPRVNSACYQCFSQYFSEQVLSCHEAGVMSPIVGLVGSMQALEAIKILTQYGQVLTDTLLMFDGMTCDWIKLKVSKSSSCKVCHA